MYLHKTSIDDKLICMRTDGFGEESAYPALTDDVGGILSGECHDLDLINEFVEEQFFTCMSRKGPDSSCGNLGISLAFS